MLHDDKAESRFLGNVFKELLKRLQSAGRGTDSNDKKCFVLGGTDHSSGLFIFDRVSQFCVVHLTTRST